MDCKKNVAYGALEASWGGKSAGNFGGLSKFGGLNILGEHFGELFEREFAT